MHKLGLSNFVTKFIYLSTKMRNIFLLGLFSVKIAWAHRINSQGIFPQENSVKESKCFKRWTYYLSRTSSHSIHHLEF